MDRRSLAAGVTGTVAVAAGVLLFDPFGDHAIGCPVLELTGLHCPGCGATRAIWLLLHGDVAGAVGHNALLLPALAYLALRWIHTVAPASTAWLPRAVRAPTEIAPAALRLLAAAIVAFAAARNLPAFDFLAPPDLT